MTRVRLVVGSLGVALGMVGAYAFLSGVPSRQWLQVVGWLAGGVVAHDAIVAPVAVVLGVLLLRRLPPVARPALRILLLAAFTATLVGLPLFVTRS